MVEPTDAAAAGVQGSVMALGELLDQVAAGVLWFDGAGRVTWVNQGALALLRLPAFIDPELELDRAVTIRDERGRTIAELAHSELATSRGRWMPATITLADGTVLAGRIRLARRLHALGAGDAIVVTVWGPEASTAASAARAGDHPERARRVLGRLGSPTARPTSRCSCCRASGSARSRPSCTTARTRSATA